jgi:hypothetical protein
MITTITPLRRVAVTLVLTGATALGAIGIAPAAFADDSAAVVEQAPAGEATQDVVPAPAPAVEAPVAEAPAPAAPENVVAADKLLTGATALRGQKITIQDVTVQSAFGTKGFWVAIPNPANPSAGGSPFLVRTEGTIPAVNSTVDVTGTVTAMAPATIDSWAADKSITENDRPLAEFASDYIAAESVTVK